MSEIGIKDVRQADLLRFRIDTQRYRYHLRLFPQKGKFHIFCYQADQMRADLPRPDFNYTYRKKVKKKKNRGERS